MLSVAKNPDNQTAASLSLNSYEALELGDPYSYKVKVKDFPPLPGPLSPLPSTSSDDPGECPEKPSRSPEEILDLYDRLERSLESDIEFFTVAKTTARDVIEGMGVPYNAPLGEIGTFPSIPFEFSEGKKLREPGEKWGKTASLPCQNASQGAYPLERDCKVNLAHPGHGEIKADVCGKVKFAILCPSGDSPPELVYDSCDRWDCPICSDNVLRETTARATERFEKVAQDYARAKVFKGDLKKHLRHWSISPPQDQFPDEESFLSDGGQFEGEFRTYIPESYKRMDRWKRKLSDICRDYSKSFYGGAVTFHGYRKKHLDGSSCECKDCDQEHDWEWGPHFHFIGYGNFRSSEEIYAKTGWVLHTITTDQESNDPQEKKTRSFSRSFYYIMSHTSIFSKSWIETQGTSRPEAFGVARPEVLRTAPRNAYWWIGAFSASNVKLLGIEKEREEGICEKCKVQRLVVHANHVQSMGLLEFWGEARPYWIVHTVRHWAVKDEAFNKWRSRYRMVKDPTGRWDSERVPEAWGVQK